MINNYNFSLFDTTLKENNLRIAELNELSFKSGLSINQPRPKIILTEESLQNILKKNELLLHSSAPIIRNINNICEFDDNTVMWMLCEDTGHIIHLEGWLGIIQSFFERGIKLGTCMNYNSCGTNALSLTIYTNSLAIVSGQEHYCQFMKNWTSVALPIKADETTIGAICIFTGHEKKAENYKALLTLMSELIAVHYKKYQKISLPIDITLFFGILILEHQLSLTIREIQLLYLLYTGNNLNIIHKELQISRNTIKTHLKSIYSKLGVSKLNECLESIHNVLMQSQHRRDRGRKRHRH